MGAVVDDRTHSFRRVQWILLILLVLALNIGVYVGYRRGYAWEDVWALVAGSTTASVAVILGLFCLKTVVWVIPVRVIYMGAGFLLPVWGAIIVTYVGTLLDLTLTYFVGRRLGKTRIMAEIGSRKVGEWVLDVAERNSSFACFIIRMLPGPPVELTNMFFGALDMPYGKFLLYSMLGLTPSILPVIFMGKAVMDPLSKEFLVPLLVTLIIAAVSILGYNFVVKKGSKSD